ncbi:unnamed protein product, partial [Mesorhabditis spiculigera]
MSKYIIFSFFVSVAAQLFYRQAAVYPPRNLNTGRQQPMTNLVYPVYPWAVGGYGAVVQPNPAVLPNPAIGSPNCPKSPFAMFLSQQEQEGLHELIVEARKTGAGEAEVKQYIDRYVQAVLSPEKYQNFQQASQQFNARLPGPY